MSLGTTIKKIREQKGLLQKQVAAELGIGPTNYNKLENGNREPSVKEMQQLSRLFGMSVDQVLNFEGELPREVTVEDKPGFEQLSLIQQLDEEDRKTIFRIIDTMLTKKKFKDFFEKNVAALWVCAYAMSWPDCKSSVILKVRDGISRTAGGLKRLILSQVLIRCLWTITPMKKL